MVGECTRLLTNMGIRIPRESPTFKELCLEMLLQERIAAQIILNRNKGDWSDTHTARPSSPPPPAVNPEEISGKDNPLISEACEAYLQERTDIKKQTHKKYKLMLNLFTQAKGDKPIRAIKPSDIHDFMKTLRELPLLDSPAKRAMTLRQLLQLQKKETARGNRLKTISTATINNGHLALLQALFNHLIPLYNLTANPVQKVRARNTTSTKKKNQRDGLPPEVTQAIFHALPEQTTLPHLRHPEKKPDYFWMPVLALYTGARLNELGWLYLEDICNKDGIDYLYMRDHEGEESHVKTEAGERKIPIHPKLIQMGFMELVRIRKEQGHKTLFPYLNTPRWDHDKVKRKPYAALFGQWYGKFLRRIGITDRKYVFHSFRHLVAHKLLNVTDYNRTLQQAILGHHPQDITAVYEALDGERYEIQTLYQAVEKIDYPDLVIPTPPLPDMDENPKREILRPRSQKPPIAFAKPRRRHTTKENTGE
jgi:integrase